MQKRRPGEHRAEGPEAGKRVCRRDCRTGGKLPLQAHDWEARAPETSQEPTKTRQLA